MTWMLLLVGWPEYHIDRIERNLVLNDGGVVVLDQLIFQRYEPDARRFVIIDWVVRHNQQVPTKDWHRDCYTWVGRLNGGQRVVVRSNEFATVRSDYDREVVLRDSGFGERGWAHDFNGVCTNEFKAAH